MTECGNSTVEDPAIRCAVDHAVQYRSKPRSLDATFSAQQLRKRFCLPTPETGRDSAGVICDLIAAAEPGLVSNTDANFFGWVMGGSDMTGVAADWLTSVWGQNAAIFQTSPSAAIAEEAVATWLLDLLDLPRDSSVGLVTGATMAGFVGLAAARSEVLARCGYDLERDGLQGAPLVTIFTSDDAHISNLAALRYLGFGERNIVHVPSNDQGVMEADILPALLADAPGPKIIIGTAGHINSGGFEDFSRLAQLAEQHAAWLHVDGAFGLWARMLSDKDELTRGLELADSWSVDGHKWLQIPYDSGFAIVKNAGAHRRVMDISASYLNQSCEDGRNPTQFNPELSRRARGFAAWAVIQKLGRHGIQDMIDRHCAGARMLADSLCDVPGIEILNRVDLNQVVLTFTKDDTNLSDELADMINSDGRTFVRTTSWNGVQALRISIISQGAGCDTGKELGDRIKNAWTMLRRSRSHQPIK
jgi:glutamate/tyrosine decarboxylase-like PLP-dependent enzyme